GCADGLIVPILNRPHGSKISVHDDAAGKIELRGLRIHRKIRDGKIIRHTASITEPLGVGGREQAGIYEIGLLHERDHFLEQRLQHPQAVHVHGREAVQVNRVHHAAHSQVLDVRGFSAKNPDDLTGFALKLQGLQVVSKQNQVHFRAQAHRRMAPVAVRENPELAAPNQAFDLVLNLLERATGVSPPGADAVCNGGCACWIRLGNGCDVHPIECGQLIEMYDVVVQGMRDENQVANVLRVRRNLELERILYGAHRGYGVDRGANSTEALRKNPAFAGIAPEQNRLDSAPHGATRPCFLHGAPIDLDIDAQVPFDASYRVYRDAGHNVSPSGSAAPRRPRASLNM